MKDFVKRMIIEHKELVERACKLETFLITNGVKTLDKVEYAAANVQLAAMKNYAEALGARLYCHNVTILGDRYVTDVDIDNSESENNQQNNEA